jgi:hypothetical protein
VVICEESVRGVTWEAYRQRADIAKDLPVAKSSRARMKWGQDLGGVGAYLKRGVDIL